MHYMIDGQHVRAEVVRFIRFQAALRESAIATARTKTERERLTGIKVALDILANDFEAMRLNLKDGETMGWE